MIGCGSQPETFVVTGQVVLNDGTPLQFGTIETLSVEKRVNARGTIQPDGTFSLTTFNEGDGAVPGEHRVVIIQTTSTPFAASSAVGMRHSHGHEIAAKYRNFSTSGLSFTVVPDSTNEVLLRVDSVTKEPPNRPQRPR